MQKQFKTSVKYSLHNFNKLVIMHNGDATQVLAINAGIFLLFDLVLGQSILR